MMLWIDLSLSRVGWRFVYEMVNKGCFAFLALKLFRFTR
ncbi:hypothetical protein BDCR2A_00455 [Borrelia duttonii CR2A]|uniref:Uncharacterized protein n=1 Tax=Borrelia duttonii CR2A TaxID=1432657 RepID=W6THI5_9SPIR|nr:hypothetical protein BDCR2A_00455 [Borrelia duttonii CR2A]